MRTDPNVEKLIAHTIRRIGQNATTDLVLEALTRGKVTDVPRPPGTNLDAVQRFRKRNSKARLAYVKAGFDARRQTALPSVEPDAETLPGSVSQQPTGITTVPSVNLSDIARQTSLELSEVAGTVYITLRSFEPLLGKRPDNLKRTLMARGFPLIDISLPNAQGNTRSTPAIATDYIFAVIGLADLHGMDAGERNQLFTLQRDFPMWMRRFEQARVLAKLPAPAPTPELPTHIMGDRGRRVPLTAIVSTIADRVVSLVQGFAERLDLRLDRIERLISTKPPPVIAPAPNGSIPKYPAPPNKFGTVKPFLSAEQLLERFDHDFNLDARTLGIDSPEAVEQLARNLGIYRTQHWGRIVRNDEWEYDGGKEAVTAYTWMKDYLQKNIVARNSQSVSFS